MRTRLTGVRSLALVSLILGTATFAKLAAQTKGIVVIPPANATVTGNDIGHPPTTPINVRSQIVIAPNLFPASPIYITGFALRASPGMGALNTSATGDFYLSTSPNWPNSTGHPLLSTTFANNVGSDNTLVFSGSLTISAPACNPPGPCPFGSNIVFTTPFLYHPYLGPLLIDQQDTSFGGPGATGEVDKEDCSVTSCVLNTVSGNLESPTGPEVNDSGSILQITYTMQWGAGIYRSSNGLWLLNTQFNDMFTSADTVTLFAGNGLTPEPTDIPVVGDWSGSGTSQIGLYRPSTGTWFLDYNGNGVYDGPTIDRQYQYGGIGGDIPVVGDWNGTGNSKVGIFRGGFLFLLNTSGSGSFSPSDQVFAFGGETGCTGLPSFYDSEPAGSCDIPVVGDWNGTGTTKVGVVRAAPGSSQPFLWILDTTGAQKIILPGTGVANASTIFAFGGIQGDVPVVGDWTHSGNTNIGVFREGFFWVEDTTANMPTPPASSDTLVAFPYGGVPGDIAVVGHWH